MEGKVNPTTFSAKTTQSAKHVLDIATVLRESFKRCLTGGVLLGLFGSLWTAGPLRASTFWGANASGRAQQFEITCSTCPNPVTDFGSQTDGGFGQPLAAVEFSAGTDVDYDAIAIFNGPTSLPHLSARASAGIKVDPATPSTFFF
jgi:hypothetical protein